MTLPPLPLIDNCLLVDNSHFFDAMQACPRLVEYQTLHGRISMGEQSALNFGSAIHLALEYRYRRYKNAQVDQACNDTQAAILTEFFAEHPVPEDDFRTLNHAQQLVAKYNEIYQMEPFSLFEYDKPQVCEHCNGLGKRYLANDVDKCYFCTGIGTNTVMAEVPFAIPLHQYKDHPIIFTGKIDLPHQRDGKVLIKDHKTNKTGGQMFWDGVRTGMQLKGYCWAFQQITGKPVHGYVANLIRTGPMPKYVKEGKDYRGKTQSPETWWSETLARETFYLNDTDLDEWKENAIAIVDEFFWHYERGLMPMKTAACCRFGRCQYWDVCTTVKSDRGVVLASGLYKDNKWSPLRTV